VRLSTTWGRNKSDLKTGHSTSKRSKYSRSIRLVVAVMAPLLFISPAYANLNDRIREAEQNVNATKSQLGAKRAEVNSLQGQVAALDAQIANLQAQIGATREQIALTSQKIAVVEAELAAKKKVLGELIKVNYINGHTSTVEVLASSSSLAEFFSQQQYVLAVKDRIDQLISQVNATKKVLDEQKASLAAQQADLETQESLAAQTRHAQAELLEATRGEEANYQAMLKNQQSALSGLYAERAALDARSGTRFNGGGPCGDYPADWCATYPNAIISFGGSLFLNKQCVAYAAYKRWQNGQPFYTGDAGDWPGYSQSPTVGSVAIWNRGTLSPWGHVAYVVGVSGETITIQEFNWVPFAYSSRTITRYGGGWPSRFWN
jgi:peptidoglycan DL-endopeptidase CwlO